MWSPISKPSNKLPSGLQNPALTAGFFMRANKQRLELKPAGKALATRLLGLYHTRQGLILGSSERRPSRVNFTVFSLGVDYRYHK